MKLEAPASYKDATVEERDAVSNGCGPDGASHLIPDYAFGADFSQACSVHDWEYTEGVDQRSVIDARFYRNLKAAAREAPFYLRPFALLAARWYYRIVSVAGAAYYRDP